MYPARLAKIVAFFEPLPEMERRENLIAYADRAACFEPKPSETFDFRDVRKDAECTDTVGVFLQVDPGQRARVRITLGPQVQTLTRALTAILCQGLEGAALQEIVALPADFVAKIVGAQLVRLRSQSVYYVLRRVQRACRTQLSAKGT